MLGVSLALVRVMVKKRRECGEGEANTEVVKRNRNEIGRRAYTNDWVVGMTMMPKLPPVLRLMCVRKG